MSVITIGGGATTGSQSMIATYTVLERTNPANGTGNIDTMECYPAGNMTGLKMGTFYGSGTSNQVRDYASIGNASIGAKRTFTGLSVDCVTGDYLGHYFGSGQLYEITKGGDGGRYYIAGDKFGGGSNTYSTASYHDAVYGSGTTTESGGIRNPFNKPFYGALGGPF